MRRIIAISIIVISICQASAQTVRDVWFSMPDSIIPYLTADNRASMLSVWEAGDSIGVTNKLQETSYIETVNELYLDARLSNASLIQMRLLPTTLAPQPVIGRTDVVAVDTIICVVRTYFSPVAESDVSFYTTNWKKLSGSYISSIVPTQFVHRPDTMTEERYAELVSWWKDAMMIKATLSSSEPMLILEGSPFAMAKDELKEMESALMQIYLKWNGEIFN